MDETTIICRCEELTLADLHEAIASDSTSIDDVKRRSRFGMGVCQGVYCLNEVAAALQRAGFGGVNLAPITQRPPARLIRLGALAASHDSEAEDDQDVERSHV